jgi:hypothetical protein
VEQQMDSCIPCLVETLCIWQKENGYAMNEYNNKSNSKNHIKIVWSWILTFYFFFTIWSNTKMRFYVCVFCVLWLLKHVHVFFNLEMQWHCVCAFHFTMREIKGSATHLTTRLSSCNAPCNSKYFYALNDIGWVTSIAPNMVIKYMIKKYM